MTHKKIELESGPLIFPPDNRTQVVAVGGGFAYECACCERDIKIFAPMKRNKSPEWHGRLLSHAAVSDIYGDYDGVKPSKVFDADTREPRAAVEGDRVWLRKEAFHIPCYVLGAEEPYGVLSDQPGYDYFAAAVGRFSTQEEWFEMLLELQPRK